MIKVSQVVIVEGRYDKIKLDSVVDGVVLTTDGFEIFRDDAKQRLFKHFSEENGIIVLTDSDDAGFKIRNFIADIARNGRVYHAYIPEQKGKEKRKQKAGKAGLVGVEGIDGGIIRQAIEDCIGDSGIEPKENSEKGRAVTAADLFEDGLNGRPGAAEKKRKLLKLAKLPTRLSTRAMLDVVTRIYGFEGYKKLVADLEKNDGAEE